MGITYLGEEDWQQADSLVVQDVVGGYNKTHQITNPFHRYLICWVVLTLLRALIHSWDAQFPQETLLNNMPDRHGCEVFSQW